MSALSLMDAIDQMIAADVLAALPAYDAALRAENATRQAIQDARDTEAKLADTQRELEELRSVFLELAQRITTPRRRRDAHAPGPGPVTPPPAPTDPHVRP